MKNAVVGIGRLGLPLLLNFERFSNDEWVGYDINTKYISALNERTFVSYESGVNELLSTTKCSFTSALADILDCSIIFLCVRTDSVITGEYDVQNVFNFIDALDEIHSAKSSSIDWIVVNCNVNPGTSNMLSRRLAKHNIQVCFWPEWVKQGEIIADQTNPPVHVLGFGKHANNKDELINTILKIDQNPKIAPVYEMSYFEAELAKITLNCFLTVKISYANMIGQFADSLGLSGEKILSAVGNDPRIGNLFFKPGAAYGGPCFPRDTKALIAFAKQFGVDLPLVEAAESINKSMMDAQKKTVFLSSHDSNSAYFEFLDFKAGTNIFSGSPNLILAQFLNGLGIRIDLPKELAHQEDMVNDKRASE